MSSDEDNSSKANNRVASLIIRILATSVVILFAIIVVASSVNSATLSYFSPSAILISCFAIFGIVSLLLIVCRILIISPKTSSDIKLDRFIDQFEQALLIVDCDDQVIYANNRYRSLCSKKGHSKTVPTLFALLENSKELTEGLYRLKIASKQRKSCAEEFRIQPMNTLSLHFNAAQKLGRWLKISVQPIGSSGETLWLIEDVTKARNQQEEFFRSLQEAINHLDQSPLGFFAINDENKLNFLNATFAAAIEVDLAEFKPNTIPLQHFIFEDDLGLILEKLQRKSELGPSHCNVRLLSKNHQLLKVQLVFQSHLFADGHRDLTRFIVIPETLTQNNRTDIKDEFRIRLDRYINTNLLAMALIDDDGRLLKWNKNFSSLMHLGISPVSKGEISKLNELILDKDGERLAKILETSTYNKSGFDIDTAIARHSDQHIKLYLSPILGESSTSKRFVVTIIETTEQKVFEEQMAQGQKLQAVGQLAGGIAHDFNNVLTAIIMSCDLLLSNHRSSDPSHPDLINIKNNANRAAALVQQLLAFSRRQTLRPEILDLTDLLSDIRMLILRLLGQNVKLQIIHGRDLWRVEVDQASFQRVIMNLAINARDAMPDGGTITITTSNLDEAASHSVNERGFVHGDYVVIAVSDTGTGISPDVQEKMFEPFFTTKEVGKGTGLGLSMVYGIVKQTGGYILCDSAIGEGTTFRIYLPRHREDGRAGDGPQSQINVENTKTISKPSDLSGTATILVVEDEDAVRLGSVRALRSRGYTVLEATTGLEALEMLEEYREPVDLVVSDVVMPEMDGPTLYQELRRLYPEIKFIFVSGYARDAFAKNIIDDGGFGFLAKPFSLKELASTVKDALSKHKN